MPYNPKEFEYKPLQAYPHMGPRDAHIWNNFVHRNPGLFKTCIYDMRCGPIEEPAFNVPQNVADAWRDLCRCRIDVVAENENEIYIIEVKPRARGEALGQALSYREMYLNEHETTKPVIPAVCTDYVLPGTRLAAERLGVKLLTA